MATTNSSSSSSSASSSAPLSDPTRNTSSSTASSSAAANSTIRSVFSGILNNLPSLWPELPKIPLHSHLTFRRTYTKPFWGLPFFETQEACLAKMKRQTANAVASEKECTGEDKDEVLDIVTYLEGITAETEKGGAVIQGRSSEDGYCVKTLTLTIEGKKDTAEFCGVFDGHCNTGGNLGATKTISENLPLYIQENLSKYKELNHFTITRAITEAVGRVNKELIIENARLRKINGDEKAATATCMLKIGDTVYIINVGDSRTILVKNPKKLAGGEDEEEEEDVDAHRSPSHYQVTEDAKPGDPRFDRGAERMNQPVQKFKDYPIRIAGMGTARDLGLRELSTQPKIPFFRLSKDDKDQPEKGELFFNPGDIIVLASDGFWDVVSNKRAAEAICQMAREDKTKNEMAAALAFSARKRWQNEKENAQAASIAKMRQENKSEQEIAMENKAWHATKELYIDDIAVVVVKL